MNFDAADARRIAPRGNDPVVAQIARVMDSAFTVPGTKIRFGLDSLISFIPGGGSALSTLIALLIVGRSAQQGVPRLVLGRMGVNILLNSLLDAIPLVGGFLTVAFRSNQRNHHLLQEYAGTGRQPTARDRLYVWGIILGVLLVAVLILIGAVVVLRKVWALVFGG